MLSQLVFAKSCRISISFFEITSESRSTHRALSNRHPKRQKRSKIHREKLFFRNHIFCEPSTNFLISWKITRFCRPNCEKISLKIKIRSLKFRLKIGADSDVPGRLSIESSMRSYVVFKVYTKVVLVGLRRHHSSWVY